MIPRGGSSTVEDPGVTSDGASAPTGRRQLPRNTTALLIVDPQFDFTEPDGALACLDTAPTSAIWTEIAALQALRFDSAWVTKDWHPKDHVSFARNNGLAPYSFKDFDVAETDLDNRPTGKVVHVHQVMWPPHCVQGSHGADFACPVAPGTVVVTKGTHSLTDSYSGFGDGMSAPGAYPKAYETSILKSGLESRGIRHVVICGIATDYCVRATALDALSYGFGVTVVQSAVRPVALDSGAAALAEMAAAGAHIVPTAADVELVAPPE